MSRNTEMKALEMAVIAVLMLAAETVAGGYRPANDDEVEVFAAALRSEYAANHWRAKDSVCFSVGVKDPSRKFVTALQQRGLRVCSQARWWGGWGMWVLRPFPEGRNRPL